MHENILATGHWGYEAVSLGPAERFHCAPVQGITQRTHGPVEGKGFKRGESDTQTIKIGQVWLMVIGQVQII